MILPIYTYGNPVLRQEGEILTPDYPDLKELIDNMFETMLEAPGVGLTAHQVGVPARLITIDGSGYAEEEPTLAEFRKVMINTKVINEEGEEWLFNEGCLSFPLLREDIQRKPVITVKYLDENFIEHQETFDGIAARIIQHEHDHSRGVLFIDRLSPLRRRLVKSKLNDIIKGKIKVDYKIKVAGKKTKSSITK